MEVFIHDPISATVLGTIVMLLALQILFALRGRANKERLHITESIID
jgi:VIT1/CCC1 family predicted Fe2+/Mn2+ transporter